MIDKRTILLTCVILQLPLIGSCSTEPSRMESEDVETIVLDALLRLAQYSADHPDSRSDEVTTVPANVRAALTTLIPRGSERYGPGLRFSASVSGLASTPDGANILMLQIPLGADVTMRIEGTESHEVRILQGQFMVSGGASRPDGLYLADGMTVVLDGYNYRYAESNWLADE